MAAQQEGALYMDLSTLSPRRLLDRAATTPVDDPVVWWLKIAIGMVITIAFVAVIYGLLTGIVSPSSPRTATEARLTLLEATIKQNPESGAAWRDYAAALYASGEKAKARKVVDRATNAVSGLDRTFPALIELDQLWAEKEYERVVTKAKRAFEADKKYHQEYIAAKARMGVTIRDSDIPSKETIEILLYQARGSGAQGDWTAAIEALTTALTYDPLASDVLVLRGDAYERDGQPDKARADYEQALKYIPDMPAALAGMERVGGAK